MLAQLAQTLLSWLQLGPVVGWLTAYALTGPVRYLILARRLARAHPDQPRPGGVALFLAVCVAWPIFDAGRLVCWCYRNAVEWLARPALSAVVGHARVRWAHRTVTVLGRPRRPAAVPPSPEVAATAAARLAPPGMALAGMAPDGTPVYAAEVDR